MLCTPEKQVLLAPYTTFNIGGAAEYFCRVKSDEALVEAVVFANNQGLPVTIIGGGSNVLVGDRGVRGLVICNQLQGVQQVITDSYVEVTARAGEVFDELVAFTVQQGWWGLENLSHIPGSVGALPVQNVGAYGVEISELITAVRVYDMDANTFLTLDNETCAFAYRDSLFKRTEGKRYVVTDVTLRLSIQPQPRLQYKDIISLQDNVSVTQHMIRDRVIAVRSEKFPDWSREGTAGSFFKNPIITKAHYERLLAMYPALPAYEVSNEMVKVPLGWILDKVLNVKGRHVGGVRCFETQALVIVAARNTTAEAVETFANDLVVQINFLLGIDVEWEVTKIGE